MQPLQNAVDAKNHHNFGEELLIPLTDCKDLSNIMDVTRPVSHISLYDPQEGQYM